MEVVGYRSEGNSGSWMEYVGGGLRVSGVVCDRKNVGKNKMECVQDCSEASYVVYTRYSGN